MFDFSHSASSACLTHLIAIVFYFPYLMFNEMLMQHLWISYLFFQNKMFKSPCMNIFSSQLCLYYYSQLLLITVCTDWVVNVHMKKSANITIAKNTDRMRTMTLNWCPLSVSYVPVGTPENRIDWMNFTQLRA